MNKNHAQWVKLMAQTKFLGQFGFYNRYLTVAVLYLLFSTANLLAHDPGLSLAEFQLQGEHLALHLTFARDDIQKLLPLDLNGDGQISPSEFDSMQTRLQSLAQKAVEVHIDDHLLQVKSCMAQLGESNAIHFKIELLRIPGLRLQINSALLSELPRGHRQFLSVRNGPENLLREEMLEATHSTVEINLSKLAAESNLRSFRKFLVLGLEHILTGYDHLAFLLGLLIVGASFSDSLKIITSFTLAHSITLALATLDLIRISPQIVEPVIAVSIVYVGLENIFNSHLRWRWLLTFAFGLIHGFGFASVLRNLGIGSTGGGVILPLLSFNLGVELGQLMIAAVTLPVIWKLRAQPTFVSRYVPACSILIALLGGFWLVERVLAK